MSDGFRGWDVDAVITFYTLKVKVGGIFCNKPRWQNQVTK